MLAGAQRCKLPKRFGVLSIDAEGVGDKVLHAWIDGGYRPEMIVYESMHNIESFEDTKSYLEKHEYRFLKTLGFNHMFEYVEPARVWEDDSAGNASTSGARAAHNIDQSTVMI